MVTKKSFARYVKDALRSFYDPGHLQTSPLAGLLAAQHDTDETKAQALRQTLRETIEALRPAPSVPLTRPEWLGYRVLWLRYVQSSSQFAICEQLGLSRASYYRRHQEAIDAVVSLLWERLQCTSGTDGQGTPSGDLPSGQQARDEAVRLARSARPRLVNLNELLEGVKHTITPLAENQGISLRLIAPTPLPVTYGDPVVFRQIVLNVLTEGIELAAGSILEMTVTRRDDELLWQLRGLDEAKLRGRQVEQLPGLVVSRDLLDVYGGRLWLQRHGLGAPAIVFCAPTAKPKSILIVDDDVDAVRLYRRYLQVYDYVIREAHSSEQLQAVIDESRPDLVLLDVLMPREDGWGILERLKRIPETAGIPVVICSVLNQPRLALALGAAEVLQKPIAEELLLRTVETVLAGAGSEGRARSA